MGPVRHAGEEEEGDLARLIVGRTTRRPIGDAPCRRLAFTPTVGTRCCRGANMTPTCALEAVWEEEEEDTYTLTKWDACPFPDPNMDGAARVIKTRV